MLQLRIPGSSATGSGSHFPYLPPRDGRAQKKRQSHRPPLFENPGGKNSRRLNQPGFFQCCVGTILVDGFDRLGTQLDLDVAAELGDVDLLCVKVRGNGALHYLGRRADGNL